MTASSLHIRIKNLWCREISNISIDLGQVANDLDLVSRYACFLQQGLRATFPQIIWYGNLKCLLWEEMVSKILWGSSLSPRKYKIINRMTPLTGRWEDPCVRRRIYSWLHWLVFSSWMKGCDPDQEAMCIKLWPPLDSSALPLLETLSPPLINSSTCL